jgi:hypothetical protein
VEKAVLGPFLVLGRPNGLGVTRLGVTCSKKVGNAVRRSLLKRRAREFFRLSRGGFPIGVDLNFVALRPKAGEAPQGGSAAPGGPRRRAPLDPRRLDAMFARLEREMGRS